MLDSISRLIGVSLSHKRPYTLFTPPFRKSQHSLHKQILRKNLLACCFSALSASAEGNRPAQARQAARDRENGAAVRL